MFRYSTRKIIDDKENGLRIKETKLKFPQKTNVSKRLTDHKKKKNDGQEENTSVNDPNKNKQKERKITNERRKQNETK